MTQPIELPVIELPVVESCDGCGACCFEQSSPPGYLRLICMPEEREFDPEDAARLDALPAEARAEIDAYIVRLKAGEFDGLGEMPCIWFDFQTRRCRWYEHRPEICRNFDRGSPGCHGWREHYQGLLLKKALT